MHKPHKYVVHPEFTNLEKFVWEGLNLIGRPISKIEHDEKKTLDSIVHKKTRENAIWHTKTEIDEYVARGLNLNPESYGKDKSRNPFYKAVAGEIRRLRNDKILIDWGRTPKRNAGMGVWRLDKTKLDAHVYNYAKDEMKNKNYHSVDSVCTVFVRQKQMAFRRELLLDYEERCAICGFTVPKYMIGAHIVPYSIMREENAEHAMDPRNGLLLCRLCDVAFETGDIIVEEDRSIAKSKYLEIQKGQVVRSWFESILEELRVRKDAKYPPERNYLRRKKELVLKASG